MNIKYIFTDFNNFTSRNSILDNLEFLIHEYKTILNRCIKNSKALFPFFIEYRVLNRYDSACN